MRRPWPFLVVWCALVVLVSGCSETSFVGKRYDNFTAYYNTFYNAEQAFEDGLESVEDQRAGRAVDPDTYLSLFLTARQSTGQQSFETAISKSADVLREHPNSKWVDEALLLIGKSYYFQQNYVGAAQKFREVQELGTEAQGEARFWLVRTLVVARRYAEAEEVASAVLSAGETENTWTARAWLARGQLYVKQERWADAAGALERGLSGEVPEELRARGEYLLGQVYETRSDYAAAASAYDRAAQAADAYEIAYAAQVGSIRVRGMRGDAAEALDRLAAMLRDDKNYERRHDLQVLRGRIQAAQDRPRRAERTLRDVLYGTDPPRGEARGEAHYALGSLYRTAYDDFSRAAAHYDTAATALSPPTSDGESVLLTPTAITDSRTLGSQYRTLADRSAEVARLDSLLRIGQMEDAEFRAFVADLRDRRAEEAEARQREREAQSSAQRFSGGIVDERQRRTQSAAGGRSGDTAFLFHDDPARVQEGRRSFQRQWGDRPRVDNWRRLAAINRQGDAGAGDAETADVNLTDPQPGSTAEPTVTGVDVSDVPRDSVSQAEMRADRAVARYELANALFLVAGQPDSAAVWYRRVLEEDSQVPVARRALYALAEVRYAEGDTARAADLYRRLLDEYPASSFAPRARQRLGRAEPVTTDSLSLTKTAYASAFEAWQSGRLDTAREAMVDVVDRFDDRAYEARALLATAMIYLEQLRTRPDPVSDSSLIAFLGRLDPSGEAVGPALETIRQEAAAPSTSEPQAPSRGPAQVGGPAQAGPERSSQSTPSRQTPSRTEPSRTEETNSDPERPDPERPDPERPSREGADQEPASEEGKSSRDTGSDQMEENAEVPREDGADSERDSESALGPYEPAVRLLAYVAATYPDARQSDRARSLAVAIYQSQTPIADAGPGDDSGDTAGEGGGTGRARTQTVESQPQREAPANRRERPDDGPPVPSRAQDAVSDTARAGSRPADPADATPDTSSSAPQRRFRFDTPERETPSPESEPADSARPQPVRIDTSRLRTGRVPAERDTAAAADSTAEQ